MTSFFSRISTVFIFFSFVFLFASSGLQAQVAAKPISSVDMIAETDGYVHPLFPGKLDPRYQNQVKIVAVPHLYTSTGVELAPQNLFYQWRKNGLVIQPSSGYGKQSILLPAEIVPRAYSMTVDVWPRDNSVRVEGMITIDPVAPFIIFYVSDPQYGPLFQKAVAGSIRIGAEKEISIQSVPFGFNREVGPHGLTQSWLINGVVHSELSLNQTVTLRSPNEEGGSATVQLSIRNVRDILQGATAGFNTIFSKSVPSSNSTTF